MLHRPLLDSRQNHPAPKDRAQLCRLLEALSAHARCADRVLLSAQAAGLLTSLLGLSLSPRYALEGQHAPESASTSWAGDLGPQNGGRGAPEGGLDLRDHDGQPALPHGLVDGVAAALGGAGGTVALRLVLTAVEDHADVRVAGELLG